MKKQKTFSKQKNYFFAIILFSLFLNTTISPTNTDSRAIPQPTLESPIPLFKERNIGLLIQERYPETSEQIIDWLRTPQAREAIHQVSGDPNKREIGHQEYRKEAYSGILVQPSSIVLTNSGKTTLKETVEALQRNKLAHNFITDRDGKIYPITKDQESIEDALKHRPFALGISAANLDGFTQCRDMNAHSVSISVVGTDAEPHSQEQIQSLAKLVAWLSYKFNINKRNIKIYGAIAYPYSTPQDPINGRRAISASLLIKDLADEGLALWPNDQHHATIYSFLKELPKNYHHLDIILWTSLALQKIGFLCPSTQTLDNPNFKAALRKFQQLYLCDNQEGILTSQTIATLNSILLQSQESDPQLLLIAPEPIIHNHFYQEWLDHGTSIQKNSINNCSCSHSEAISSSCDNSNSIT